MTANSTALVRGRDAREALPPPVLTIASGRSHTAETILRAWFNGKAPNTIRGYRHDLEDFALFLSRSLGITPRLDIAATLTCLFKQSSPSAHEIVLAFRDHLVHAHLSSASTNRHIATLRSVTKLGRMLGMMTWYIELGGVKHERRKDVMGPTVADIRAMLDATSGDTEAETRAYAMVTTFYCLGLRVSELCGLNLEETDLSRGTTWIKGKGRKEKELVPLPALVVTAIRRYLTHRGLVAGPLFLTRGTAGKIGMAGSRPDPCCALCASSANGSASTPGVMGSGIRRSPRRSNSARKPALASRRFGPTAGTARSRPVPDTADPRGRRRQHPHLDSAGEGGSCQLSPVNRVRCRSASASACSFRSNRRPSASSP
jgi:site-specific recombinase XerD